MELENERNQVRFMINHAKRYIESGVVGKKAQFEKVAHLDPQTATAIQIAEAFDGEYDPVQPCKCTECGERKWDIISFENPKADCKANFVWLQLCGDCLEAAMKMVRK